MQSIFLLTPLLLQLNHAKLIGSVPKSCEDIAKTEVRKSGLFEVNFLDGQEAPATVECYFEEGLTGYGNFKSEAVEHCSGIGCHTMRMTYENTKQMEALIVQSRNCFQEITFICKHARINHGKTNYLTYVDATGTFRGVEGEFSCNNNARKERQNVIRLESDLVALPIKSISYGPMKDQRQEAIITVGPLYCNHKELQTIIEQIKKQDEYSKMPKSCRQLKNQRGFNASGIYKLDFDGKGGELPAEAYCDFEEKYTAMGKTIKRDVHSCATVGCFTVPITTTYKSFNQLKALIKISKHCQQTITFHCKRSRIYFQGQQFLTYRNDKGVSKLIKIVDGRSKCNRNLPKMRQDTIVIDRKSALPLQSVSYGPFNADHNQKAIIEVSPVVCYD